MSTDGIRIRRIKGSGLSLDNLKLDQSELFITEADPILENWILITLSNFFKK